nr:unnamed protein product [Spirometra erinaceieuropaei]
MSFPTEVDVTTRDMLRTWAVRSRIPHQHLTNMLKLLRQMKPADASNMPSDARTLLGGAGDLPPVTALGSGESSGFNLRQVDTPEQLDALVNALGDNTYRQQLATYLCSLGGDTVVSFVDRVFAELFSEEITSFVTFYGRQQGKRPFFETPLCNLVLGSADELYGDKSTYMAAPSFSPVHLNEAKVPANNAQTAENRGMLKKDHSIIIQGLSESSASTLRERVAADLEQFQKILNEMLQPTEDITVLKAFRLGSRTNAAPQTRRRPLKSS